MIYRFVKVAFLTCLTVLTTVGVSAQSQRGREIGVKLYFPYDQAYIAPTYMDNERTLSLVDSLLRDTAYISTLGLIEVVAQSSPEGRVEYNARLSERRRLVLKDYFETAYPQINPSLWSFKAVAENWALFHRHLEKDINLPNREQVLAISGGDRDADDKEWLLKTLDGGRPWQYIKQNILPSHRFGASILFVPATHTPVATQLQFSPRKISINPQISLPEYKMPMSKQSKMLFALKTNLVLDAMSVVNLAVEVPIGRRWSVVGEVIHPWWRSWPADFTMQMESYHGELKYWLGDRTVKEQLQGWSVGLYGGWGRFDVQPFSKEGVQCSRFADFGLELGYAHSVARNLNLEYTVGWGYVMAEYEKYKMAYQTDEFGDIKVIPYPWMHNNLRTILPTRCGVSLVWTIKGQRSR